MSTDGAISARTSSEHRRHLLCVDDAEILLESLGQILEMNGYQVTTSASPVQTAQTIASGDFDLAVLDYDMPAITGTQLAAWLKTAPKHELRFVDLMVRKSEGVPALLAAIATFLPGPHA